MHSRVVLVAIATAVALVSVPCNVPASGRNGAPVTLAKSGSTVPIGHTLPVTIDAYERREREYSLALPAGEWIAVNGRYPRSCGCCYYLCNGDNLLWLEESYDTDRNGELSAGDYLRMREPGHLRSDCESGDPGPGGPVTWFRMDVLGAIVETDAYRLLRLAPFESTANPVGSTWRVLCASPVGPLDITVTAWQDNGDGLVGVGDRLSFDQASDRTIGGIRLAFSASIDTPVEVVPTTWGAIKRTVR